MVSERVWPWGGWGGARRGGGQGPLPDGSAWVQLVVGPRLAALNGESRSVEPSPWPRGWKRRFCKAGRLCGLTGVVAKTAPLGCEAAQGPACRFRKEWTSAQCHRAAWRVRRACSRAAELLPAFGGPSAI